MERLKAMKERLMSCVEGQLNDLRNTDAEELGEVVDMIKDLEEAIYYCTVVKAMEEKEKEPSREMMYYPVMYYNDNGSSSNNTSNNTGMSGNGRGYSNNRYYYPMKE